jgi:bifunctional enzyme CysN/CysC
VLADPYRDNGVTGAFILIDEHSNDTVAAGIIRRAREVKPAIEGRRDVTWHPSAWIEPSAGGYWERPGPPSG